MAGRERWGAKQRCSGRCVSRRYARGSWEGVIAGHMDQSGGPAWPSSKTVLLTLAKC